MYNLLLLPVFVLLSLATAAPSPSLPKRAVTCLTVGQSATATWKNAAGQTCRWTGTVGSNFGKNSVNGGEYVITSLSSTLVCTLLIFAQPSHTVVMDSGALVLTYDDSYSCNGRCGAGCSGFALGNAYTQDCFSHDVCSWFNNASGGARYVVHGPTTKN